MLRRIRKSSRNVTLVLIGVAALAGCGSDKRDVYATREDCLADWGNKPEDCTPATKTSHSSRGYWYGPSYSHSSIGSSGNTWSSSRSSSLSSSGRSSSFGSSRSVSRGGFGSSGRSSSG